MFQHRPGDSKEDNTAAVRCFFDLQTVGSAVCTNSLVFPRQWKMLQALKMPPRAFFWASTRERSLETALCDKGSFTTKEDVNLASITESRDAGMVMNADSAIYARLNRSENGRADSVTIEERSTEKSCKRKDRRWTLGWDSSTVTRDSGARFESS